MSTYQTHLQVIEVPLSDGTRKVIDCWKVTHDINGNPRYVVHYLDVAGEGETYFQVSRRFGRKYRAKWFGGGIVFQSYDVKGSLREALEGRPERRKA